MECKDCVHCEMYNNDDALCRFYENWVEMTKANSCDDFIMDGGCDE